MGTPEVGTDALLRRLDQIEADLEAAESGGGGGGGEEGLNTAETFARFTSIYFHQNLGPGSILLEGFSGAGANEAQAINNLTAERTVLGAYVVAEQAVLDPGDDDGFLQPLVLMDLTGHITDHTDDTLTFDIATAWGSSTHKWIAIQL